MKKFYAFFAAVALIFLGSLGSGSAAWAGEEPTGGGESSQESTNDGAVDNALVGVPIFYAIVNKTTTSGYTNFAQRLTYCQAGSPGISCTISSTYSATRTIGVDLGWNRAGVAASLSISSSASLAVGVSCTSPPLSTGQIFAAYPKGTRYTYQIRRTGGALPTVYSGTLTAFNPNGGIYCRVQ